MASLRLVVASDNVSSTTLQAQCVTDSANRYTGIQEVINLLFHQRGGQLGGTLAVAVLDTGVKATATITFSGAPVADETLVIANVTFTAKGSGATGNQFNIGGDVTTTAANLVTAVNASANLTGKVVATSALGVVTLTANDYGTIGNGLQISENMTNTAATAFANGAAPTSSVTYTF